VRILPPPVGNITNHVSKHHLTSPLSRRVISAADDAYESAESRRWAATILNTPELLQLHALARCDVSPALISLSLSPFLALGADSSVHIQSVPGTRQHFTKILCGYDDPPKSSEKRAAAARKEKEKKPVSRVIYEPFTGAFEM
jgi:hypothetical protein